MTSQDGKNQAQSAMTSQEQQASTPFGSNHGIQVSPGQVPPTPEKKGASERAREALARAKERGSALGSQLKERGSTLGSQLSAKIAKKDVAEKDVQPGPSQVCG